MLKPDQPAGLFDRREPQMSAIGRVIEDLNTNPILLEHIAPAMNPYNGSNGQSPFMITVAADDLGSFAAQALDIVIVGTALPTIAKDLLASSLEYSWVGSAYPLASASLVTVWVRLSDIFGRKTVMIVCYLLFLSGSLVSALSQSIPMLIAGRALQGAGGGSIVVLSNVCLADMFSIRERGLYISALSAAGGIGAILGPILGGVLTGSGPGWRWCFWINLPIGLFSLAILVLSLNLHNPKTPMGSGLRAIDWPGVITITGGTVLLPVGLQFGGVVHPWGSTIVICFIAAGIVTMGIFVFLQVFVSTRPIVALRLLNNWSSVAALVICACHGSTVVACLYFLPLYFQLVLQASPTEAGVWLLALAGVLIVVSAASGVIISKLGHYRPIIWIACFSITLGYGLFISFPSIRDWPRIIVFQMIAAVGIGCLFQAPLIALQARTPASKMSSANSTYAFTREISSAIGIIAGQVVIQNQLGHQKATLLDTGIPEQVVVALPRDFATFSGDSLASLIPEQQAALRQALTNAIRSVWILNTALATVALMASFLLRRQELSRIHHEFKTGLESPEET